MGDFHSNLVYSSARHPSTVCTSTARPRSSLAAKRTCQLLTRDESLRNDNRFQIGKSAEINFRQVFTISIAVEWAVNIGSRIGTISILPIWNSVPSA
jgi:hypothetical protein